MKHVVRYPSQRPVQSAMQDEIRQVFKQFFDSDNQQDESSVVTSQWVPRVDILEEGNRFVIHADLPGVDPQDVEVLMDKGILSIRGERQSAGGDEARYSRIERRAGSFHRRFALPDSADPEGITASGRNGVLEISIPKRPETTPRRIQVGAGGNTTQ